MGLERGVATREGLVDEKDLGIQMSGDREPEAPQPQNETAHSATAGGQQPEAGYERPEAGRREEPSRFRFAALSPRLKAGPARTAVRRGIVH